MFSILIAAAMVAAIQTQMLVPTPWLAAHATDPGVVILDIATSQEYAAGHIPGARLIDRNSLILDHRGRYHDELPSAKQLTTLFTNAGIADAGRVIVYSRDPLLATRAFFTLDYVGVGDRVALLDGGYAKWVAEGHTVSTAVPAFAPVAFEPRLKRNILATKISVNMALSPPHAMALIDARPAQQYTGRVKGQDIGRAGCIPGAKSIPWTLNITEQLFAAPDQLSAMYRANGVNENAPIIIYCRTGMEGSMTYFVLRYLGYHPALYDGSYDEWSQTERVVNLANQ